MASYNTIANLILVLRIITLMLLAASVVVMATDTYSFGGVKTTFKDLKTYRFVFATAVIGFAYTLIQIPFAIYHVCTKKRLIRNECLPEFDFYADKVISFLLATGAGAGLAASIELKNVVKGLVPLLDGLPGFGDLHAWKSDADKFLDRGIIATSILLIMDLCMAITSILSSISRTRGRGFFT